MAPFDTVLITNTLSRAPPVPNVRTSQRRPSARFGPNNTRAGSRPHYVDRRVVDRDTPIGGRPPGDADLCGLCKCACSCHGNLLSIPLSSPTLSRDFDHLLLGGS